MAKTQVPKSTGLFSTEEYKKGDIKIREQIGEQLNKLLLKGAGYLVSTILGGLIVIVWGMRSEISEIQGQVSTPSSYLETIDERLNKFEKENKELQERNYELEINKLELELELKNKEKNGN